MASTWEFTVAFANRAKRTLRVTGVRTEGALSKTYTIAHRIPLDADLSDEADKLVTNMKQMSDADRDWAVPELAIMFPGAAIALKTKMETIDNV